MNFQDLKRVEDYKTYLDYAFTAARKKAEVTRTEFKGPPLEKSKKIELLKLREVEITLNTHFRRIITCFPNLDNLPEFYQEMVRNTLDYVELKRALGALNWAMKKVSEFTMQYKKNIKATYDIPMINKHRRMYYGRISSVVRQVKSHLEIIERARKTMLTYPSIKTSCFTVCIAGFPNVGKSTLLGKLTTARPEIKPYPFTTKVLNLGYAEYRHQKVQFIDTPGTLNRPDKMNPIEKLAFLAMKYQAKVIIYIFDLTETAYSIKDQETLLKSLNELDKPILVYLSKTDLMKEEDYADFKQKKGAIVDIAELNEKITSHLKEWE